MVTAKINNKTFEITTEGDKPIINGEPLEWDFGRVSANNFHVIYKNKSYAAELVQLDKTTKTITLKINGNIHKVELRDRYDLLLEKMGMSAASTGRINSVKAPMPGLIVQVNAEVGDVVKAGDALLVLEAMKMENMIKASAEAKISQIKVKKGDSVEKGQVLIEFQA
jgi:biotin carboxyl carrier protein